jgi:hypothetical protein
VSVEVVPTVRELIVLAHDGSVDEWVARFGTFALVGPPVVPSDELPGFRYATEHGRRPGNAPHPMASLLDSVVYGLLKRAGSPFAAVIVIGRAPNSDVWIDDARVSKLHARVAVDPTRGLVISDAGSANGTFVDDHPLHEREDAPLVEGTRVRFGDRPFTVRHVPTLYTMLRRFPRGTG